MITVNIVLTSTWGYNCGWVTAKNDDRLIFSVRGQVEYTVCRGIQTSARTVTITAALL